MVKTNNTMRVAAAVLLFLASGCARMQVQGKHGGPTDTEGTCGAGPCVVTLEVGPGCYVTAKPFKLHVPSAHGKTTITWKLADPARAGWAFDQATGIDFGAPGEFANPHRQDDHTFTVDDNNTQRNRQFPYNVRLKNSSGPCDYDPIVINDA